MTSARNAIRMGVSSSSGQAMGCIAKGVGYIWTPRRASLGLSANHTELGRRELLDREVLSAGPRLPEVIGHLHTKPRLRARPERFREAEGHFD